jgi:hypothetical protein
MQYGPTITAQKPDGTPFYAPDVAEIDAEIVAHWETRATSAHHPMLRARYADIVWDLKKCITGIAPNVLFAQGAIDAYRDAVGAGLYRHHRFKQCSRSGEDSTSHSRLTTRDAFRSARTQSSLPLTARRPATTASG